MKRRKSHRRKQKNHCGRPHRKYVRRKNCCRKFRSNPPSRGPAIKLVETKSGMALLETKPRYDVMLFGKKFDQLYWNLRGYVGYLPTPDGKRLDIGERGIAAFKAEAAKLNREWAQKSLDDKDSQWLKGRNPPNKKYYIVAWQERGQTKWSKTIPLDRVTATQERKAVSEQLNVVRSKIVPLSASDIASWKRWPAINPRTRRK